MSDQLISLGAGFWSIRGTFRIGGVLDVGTQAGLVQLSSGRFVLLDSYPLRGAVRESIMRLTDQGRAVDAILNLHPFHTLHCATMSRDFPHAKLYGSRRHHQQHPGLAWQADVVESPAVLKLFADDLTFSLPRGLDYISNNTHVHAGSLLAWHKASKTLHVDDTLCLLSAPKVLRWAFARPKLILHPTTPKALSPDLGAASAFDNWIKELATLTAELRWLCAAHSGYTEYLRAGEFSAALLQAFQRMKPKLYHSHSR